MAGERDHVMLDPPETKAENAFRADVACHWEDSDAVVQEMLVTVSSACDFRPSPVPSRTPYRIH